MPVFRRTLQSLGPNPLHHVHRSDGLPSCSVIWEIPKIRVIVLSVPKIGIIVYRGRYWRSLYLGKLPFQSRFLRIGELLRTLRICRIVPSKDTNYKASWETPETFAFLYSEPGNCSVVKVLQTIYHHASTVRLLRIQPPNPKLEQVRGDHLFLGFIGTSSGVRVYSFFKLFSDQSLWRFGPSRLCFGSLFFKYLMESLSPGLWRVLLTLNLQEL